MTGLQAELRSERPRLRVTLDLPGGDTVAVVGPNGAGKTTLLHALAGIRACEGFVRLGGEDWTNLPPYARSVGLVYQDHSLFPHLSVLDNVAFGLRSRGVRRSAARSRAAVLLDEIGLADLADRRPGTLSGGQSQRVAIARALAVEPEILLLDEPFAALDVGVAQGLRTWLHDRLAGFAGITVLVTHDPIDVFTLADQVLVLEDGSITQLGTPAGVAARPATPHAARLAGRNVLRGTSAGHRVTLETGAVLESASEVDGPVIVSFSPAAITLHREEPAGSARNRWRSRVAGVAPTLPSGSPTASSGSPPGRAVRVRLAEPDILVEVTSAAVEELGLAPGQLVWATLKATEIDVLASGRTR